MFRVIPYGRHRLLALFCLLQTSSDPIALLFVLRSPSSKTAPGYDLDKRKKPMDGKPSCESFLETVATMDLRAPGEESEYSG